MKIIILKDKKAVSILDVQEYIIEAIVRAHGGDAWMEMKEGGIDWTDVKVGDLVLTDRSTDEPILHMKG